MNKNILVKLLGWPGTILQGDIAMFDRWRWLRKHLSPTLCRTLDAGCGSGAYAMYAAKIGNRTTGLSWSDDDLHKARTRAELLKLQNIDFIQVDLRELDRWSERLGLFDQIICLETIEHILNDRKLVKDLVRLLQPGGRLLMTTPHKYYRPLRGDKISDHEDGGHVRWGYTHDELRDIFEENGLTVESKEFICGWVTQKLANLTRVLHEKIGFAAGSLILIPFRFLWPLDHLITNLLKYPYLTVAVVGRQQALTRTADSRIAPTYIESKI